MSIDFMVFDPAVAPRSPRAFRSWYREQIDWPEDYDHSAASAVAALAIQSWYRDMRSHFPDSNQPGVEPQAINETYGDYNFTRHVCYVAFRPAVADEAWALIRTLAAQHGLGTYNPNSDDERSSDCIRFPDGILEPDPPGRGGIFSFFRSKS
jgi:hypothetical protein